MSMFILQRIDLHARDRKKSVHIQNEVVFILERVETSKIRSGGGGTGGCSVYGSVHTGEVFIIRGFTVAE